MPASSKVVSKELRIALLTAHDHTCAHTGQPLDEAVLEVDHVIPRELAKKGREAELQRVIAHYELPARFSIDSLDNLVPTTRQFNRQKSAHTGVGEGEKRWESVIKRGLARAAERRDRVQHEWDRLRAEARLQQLAADHRDALDPARAHDLLAGVPDHFPDRDPDTSASEFVMSRSGVRVSCFLPAYPRVEGTALVQFRTLTMRGSGITLDHNQILTYLAAGRGGEISPEERPFVVGFGNAARGGDDPESVLVQLPHNRFWLPRVHAAQLADIADRLTGAFLTSASSVEHDVLHSAAFARARDGGYRLLRLSADHWSLLLAYARAHAYEAGPLPAHAFDVRGGTIVVYAHEPNDGAVAPRAVLGGEIDSLSSVWALTSGRHDVWLCWRPTLAEFWDDGAERLATGRTWSVERTHAWLMQHVLPAAAAWVVASAQLAQAARRESSWWIVRSARRLRSRAWLRSDARGAEHLEPSSPAESDALLQSLRQGDGRAVVATASGPVRWTNLGTLTEDVLAMQQWYSVLGGRVARSALRRAALGTYELLSECLECFEVPPSSRPYLDENVGLPDHPNLAGAVRARAAKVSAGGPASGLSVDYTLRGILAILQEGQLRDTPHRVLVAASTHLAPAYELYREAEQLRRLRIQSPRIG